VNSRVLPVNQYFGMGLPVRPCRRRPMTLVGIQTYGSIRLSTARTDVPRILSGASRRRHPFPANCELHPYTRSERQPRRSLGSDVPANGVVLKRENDCPKAPGQLKACTSLRSPSARLAAQCRERRSSKRMTGSHLKSLLTSYRLAQLSAYLACFEVSGMQITRYSPRRYARSKLHRDFELRRAQPRIRQPT
jgi:hypothetical protein